VNVPHQPLIDKIKSIPKLIFSDDFEITIQESDSSSITFINGERSGRHNEESVWINLRLQHQKRPGRASTLYYGDQSLSDLVEAAFEAAKHSTPDPWFRFPIWRGQLKESTPGITEAEVPESFYSKLVWRPERLEERVENWSLKTSLYRKTEKQVLKTDISGQTVKYAAVQRVGDLAVKMSSIRSAPSGRMESERCLEELLRSIYYRQGGNVFSRCEKSHVLFGAQPVGEILRAIGPWFAADRVQQGTSPLCGRQGEAFASPIVDIYDDPHHERSAWKASVDLEGSSTQRTKLVEKGASVGLLYDVYTATRENRLSSGNLMRRGGVHFSEILPWHLRLSEGASTNEEMLSQMGDGLFIDYCSRLEEVPLHPHLFIFHGMGWRVKQSAPEEPVWYIRFQVDLFDLMRRVGSVGKTPVFFGNVATPSILVENLPLEK